MARQTNSERLSELTFKLNVIHTVYMVFTIIVDIYRIYNLRDLIIITVYTLGFHVRFKS